VAGSIVAASPLLSPGRRSPRGVEATAVAADGERVMKQQAKAAVAAKEAKTEGKPPAEQKDAAKRPARLGQLER
jgi:hypothetical protein